MKIVSTRPAGGKHSEPGGLIRPARRVGCPFVDIGLPCFSRALVTLINSLAFVSLHLHMLSTPLN
jgi:hypothetical protein